jgi:uncharacterized protein (DUF2249 family)
MSLEIHQIASTPPNQEPATHSSTTPNAEVIAAIAHHHTALADQLATLTTAVIDGARSGSFDKPQGDLIAWFATELLPHARAEETTLYSSGSLLGSARLLVEAMVAEHRALEVLVTDLGNVHDAFAVAVAAGSAKALFAIHLDKENDLLLPALDLAGVDLGAALTGMHEILGGTGEPDELDVRTLPHGGRHEIIFARLDQLQPGGRFVILNDHDPKPLRYQTEALWPGMFTWSYLESGPLRWRVEITRVG